MSNRPKPAVLLILDGFGRREERDCSAIAMANTPCWQRIQQQWPLTKLVFIGGNRSLMPGGRSMNLALAMPGVPQPAEMTAQSLFAGA